MTQKSFNWRNSSAATGPAIVARKANTPMSNLSHHGRTSRLTFLVVLVLSLLPTACQTSGSVGLDEAVRATTSAPAIVLSFDATGIGGNVVSGSGTWSYGSDRGEFETEVTTPAGSVTSHSVRIIGDMQWELVEGSWRESRITPATASAPFGGIQLASLRSLADLVDHLDRGVGSSGSGSTFEVEFASTGEKCAGDECVTEHPVVVEVHSDGYVEKIQARITLTLPNGSTGIVVEMDLRLEPDDNPVVVTDPTN